jgi:ABC-type phosphate transport system substrate-binding protein
MKYLALIIFSIFYAKTASCEVFIVNSANAQTAISKAKIRDIFKGSLLLWDNAEKIIIAEYSATAPIRISMSEKYLGILPNQVYLLWIRISLSGKASPPKIQHSEEEVKKMMAITPGGIGYISSAENLPIGVKILTVTQE